MVKKTGQTPQGKRKTPKGIKKPPKKKNTIDKLLEDRLKKKFGVPKSDIIALRSKMQKGGKVPEGYHRTKDGGVAKKGLYYYMNKAKKAGKSRPGKGTVTDKALKASAKTAKKK